MKNTVKLVKIFSSNLGLYSALLEKRQKFTENKKKTLGVSECYRMMN